MEYFMQSTEHFESQSDNMRNPARRSAQLVKSKVENSFENESVFRPKRPKNLRKIKYRNEPSVSSLLDSDNPYVSINGRADVEVKFTEEQDSSPNCSPSDHEGRNIIGVECTYQTSGSEKDQSLSEFDSDSSRSSSSQNCKKTPMWRKAKNIKQRPQYRVSGFLEDFAEFIDNRKETEECHGRFLSSVLESTVNGSIINVARSVNSRSSSSQNSKEKTKRRKVKNVNRRPQYQLSGFLEDFTEFIDDGKEAAECHGRYLSSVLESTVNGSIIRGARRVYTPRRTTKELRSRVALAIESETADKDPLKALDDLGLKNVMHQYKCSNCEEISKDRVDIESHISEKTHTEAVVLVLLGDKAQGKKCSICNTRFKRKEYFRHIREKHANVFPLRCGYCVFQGQDYNQLRHHIQKKHKTSDFKIIETMTTFNRKRIPDENGASSELEPSQSDEIEDEDDFDVSEFNCPLCGHMLKSLQGLKRHVMRHSSQKIKCIMCDYIANFPSDMRYHFHRRHPKKRPEWKKISLSLKRSDIMVKDINPLLRKVIDMYGVRKPKEKKTWVRQYKCPHCDYICNFNSSYNRHLRIHEGSKPYKCVYCDFHGREIYVVRRHCLKEHKGKAVKYILDKDFKVPYRYAKKNVNSANSEDMVNVEMEKVRNPSLSSKTVSSNMEKERLPSRYSAKTSQSRKCKNNDSTDDTQQAVLSEDGMQLDKTVCKSGRGRRTRRVPRRFSEYLKGMPLIKVEEQDLGRLELEKEETLHGDNENVSKPSGQLVSAFNEHCFNSSSEIDNVCKSVDVSQRKEKELLSEVHDSLDEVCDSIPVLVLRDEPGNEVISYSVSCDTLPKPQKVTVKTSKYPETAEDLCGGMKSNKANEYDMQTVNTNTSLAAEPECVIPHIKLISVSDEATSISEKPLVMHLYADGYCTPKEYIIYNDSEIAGKSMTCHQASKPIGDDSHLEVSMICDVTGIPLGIPSKDKPTRSVCNALNFRKSKGHNVRLGYQNSSKGADVVENREKNRTEEVSTSVSTTGHKSSLHTPILTAANTHPQRDCISSIPRVKMRDWLGLDYNNSDYFSLQKVRTMMKKSKGGRVKCVVCGISTTLRAFYKHAKKHFNIKPFKCGYCSYRSIEKSKIRVHNAFCHPGNPWMILKLTPQSACTKEFTEESVSSENYLPQVKHESQTDLGINGRLDAKSNCNAPIEKVLNKNMLHENSEVKHPSPTDGLDVKSAFQDFVFHCPICKKILKHHTSSIKRHLCSHYGYKPYMCGYCSYTAIKPGEIRAHHVKHVDISFPKIESSGVPMPPALAKYLEVLKIQHRGSKEPCKNQKIPNHLSLEQSQNKDTDIMHQKFEPGHKDLAIVCLNLKNESRQVLESCPSQQSLLPGELHLKSPYNLGALDSE
ncbi:hypothetical protein SK128_022365 [Halocaridina rubra]|uniref:C2H2-type domain-containing protein n=1 Tax=Halocaridina rubra TaxID=373956 RepID=A0AAN8WK41_HALRR